MKRKSLLVGASAPFEGPWVGLEKGQWLVVPPPFVEIWNGERIGAGPDRIFLTGPTKIRAVVLAEYDEKENGAIFLEVRCLPPGVES